MTELGRLADLDDGALAAAYEPARTPWLRVNFVATVDGAVQGPDGRSGTINDPVDKRVFTMLRRRADVLVVGAGTLRAEEYAVPALPLVVVSRSGEVPERLRGAPRGRVLLATCATSAGLAAARDLLGADQVLVHGEDEVDLAAVREDLVARGWGEILCEGGPELLGGLLRAGAVDEVDLTIVPRLVGGDHLRMVTGPHLDVALDPVLLLEQDGTLVGRWLVA